MSSKRALITGVTGQDGSYLAELLLEKGYEVHGVVRRASTENYERIQHLRGRIHLHAHAVPRLPREERHRTTGQGHGECPIGVQGAAEEGGGGSH